MSRVVLSEFRAKQLIFDAFNTPYEGFSVDLGSSKYPDAIKKLPADGLYVVKVDQAVKQRNKKGLVKVKRTREQCASDLSEFRNAGYGFALVEPFIVHSQDDERYVSLVRTEEGVRLTYSSKGGVDVEKHKGSLQHAVLAEDGFDTAANKTELENQSALALYRLFQEAHMTLLEINPFIIAGQIFTPLDAAAEVDSAAQFFVGDKWAQADIRKPAAEITPEEAATEALNNESPASFSLRVLNPKGAIFMLLSGGGASVVIADEISQAGLHDRIANYGEYSGNPSEEETYLYTSQVLRLLLASPAPGKQLIIAGGVANFTDVAKTFAGIRRAIAEQARALKAQNVFILVRRGGPNQKRALMAMDNFLEAMQLYHEVFGPEVSISKAVAYGVERMR